MSRSAHHALWAICAPLIVVSCDLAPLCVVVEPCTAVRVTVTIRGQVSTASLPRSAIVNALVTLQELGWPRTETSTDAMGHYELSYRPLRCNLNQVMPFVVVVTAPGYAPDSSHNPARWSRILCSNEPQAVDILLNPVQASS